jgi:hypothetical protein
MNNNFLYHMALSQQRYYTDRIRILEHILEHSERTGDEAEKLNAEYKYFIERLDNLRRQNYNGRKI